MFNLSGESLSLCSWFWLIRYLRWSTGHDNAWLLNFSCLLYLLLRLFLDNSHCSLGLLNLLSLFKLLFLANYRFIHILLLLVCFGNALPLEPLNCLFFRSHRLISILWIWRWRTLIPAILTFMVWILFFLLRNLFILTSLLLITLSFIVRRILAISAAPII